LLIRHIENWRHESLAFTLGHTYPGKGLLGNDLEHLFSVEYVTGNFPILDNTVACEILNVVNDIFQDIDEASSEEQHFNWVRDDFYFSEVADSYDSEESDN
jgi:hypothetical protein